MRRPRGSMLATFLAAISLPACNGIIPATIAPTTTNRPVESTGGAPAVPASTDPGAWQTYQSPQAGYSVEYPADWMVSEQVGEDGSITTTFLAPHGGGGIIIMVQSGELGSAGSLDIPNTRCEEVRIGGLAGTRCFDSLNFVASTTLSANGQTITIASLSKRIDEAVYEHVLASFQLV